MRLVRTTALLAAVAASAGLAAGITGTVEAVASPGPDWGPCPEDTLVQCTTVTVPVDWSRPHGDTIEIAIARQPAADSRGTLFFMPGGPGGSGVSELIEGDAVPPELAARYDVVSFDPRGTNRSNPVVCDADLVANPPHANPDAGATFASLVSYGRTLGASCREHTGPLVDHVDSVSVARDIDAIRAVLGERKLSLYGRSYGTLAGQMYAERFPSRVRALVLDSVFDHSLTPEEFLSTEAATGEDSFGEFADWCAARPACVVPGRNARGVFDAAYRQSVAGQLTDPNDPGQPLRPMDLVSRMVSFFYGPSWPQAAQFLHSLATQPVTTRARAEVAPFPIGSFCADHRVRITSEAQWLALWQRQGQFAPTLRTHFAWLPVSLCAAWPSAVGNPQHQTHIHGTPTVLVLNSLHDPATAYRWARNVTRQLDGALLTYDGWGHGVAGRSACTLAVTMRYLANLEIPRPGTHCPAVPPEPTPSRTAASTEMTW